MRTRVRWLREVSILLSSTTAHGAVRDDLEVPNT
jgi:hypothetical protein